MIDAGIAVMFASFPMWSLPPCFAMSLSTCGKTDQAVLQHAMQSYRKAVTATRKDKKPDKRQGLTEEQKQEIRFVHGRCCQLMDVHAPPPFPPQLEPECLLIMGGRGAR